MFSQIKEWFINFITSRLLVLVLIFLGIGTLLIYRIFNLQIVKGEEYLNNFQLKIKKEKTIPASRGNIYDCNGEVLAYNELAYSVTIEDVFESGKKKNAQLNDTIYRLIKMIEKCGDSITNDFDIVLDSDGRYAFAVEEGTKRKRFLADVYGKTYITDLEYSQETATAEEVVAYLAGRSKFGIGDYADPEDSKSFQIGMGYTKEEVLKILTIRYAMNLNSFQKYIATTVATDVSEETVAVIMENSNELEGVAISEDTIRKYVDSEYFCHIVGYTGKVSTEELAELQQKDAQGLPEGEPGPHDYTQTDIVGKSGIESFMELTLQGIKGSETVFVDNLGKVIESSDLIDSVAGNDVYLTIDKELQKATYSILEQKIAGILLDNIINIKEFKVGENAKSSSIRIPIYDVYIALFHNNVIDFSHFAEDNAGETEKAVQKSFLAYKQDVMDKTEQELTQSRIPYKDLSPEYQIYESYIVSMLSKNGIILDSEVDTSDPTYIAWKTEETISLAEYIEHAISRNWIDVSKLELSSRYSDADEIYSKIVEYIITNLDRNSDFYKRIYRFMIQNDVISGQQVCQILCEQSIIEIDEKEESDLYSGSVAPYNFMRNRIENLDITPAQLALDPYSASMAITDVDNGNVLALVSYPGYDNNRLANGVDADYFAQLLNDQSTPLLNYATQQKTAPGSTFKMVSATAGLLEGAITVSSPITCYGIFDKITQPPKCWIYPSSHGTLNVTGGIEHSCNSFFYEVGYRLSTTGDTYNTETGLKKLAKYADLYGLSETSGIEIDESVPQMSSQDPVRSAIGQGNSNYTTVGLARYVTTVANKGTCYNLTLIDKVSEPSGQILYENHAAVRNRIEMEDSYWNAIHDGMRKVVESKSYYRNFGVNVAGKTGTAEESNSRAPHALFVAFAPFEKPEIAIATRIAYGYSSGYAAQTTKEVLKYYFDLADEDEILTGKAINVESGANEGD